MAKLNQQIHTFIAHSLDQIAGTQTYRLIAKTGDGAIILFQHAEDAHRFGFQVHLSAQEHTGKRSESTAGRWFRVGIATGDVNVTSALDLPCEYAGTAITNAVRLEASARAGELVVDANTFGKLSAEAQALYGSEEVTRGKRDERFRARRCRVTNAIRPSTVTLRLQRRPSILAAGMPGLFLALFCLFLIPAVGERVKGMLFSSSEKHIAILPLDFVGETPETQALGDGLMDSLAGKLANLDRGNQSLFVIPASEVRRRKVIDPQSALREFGARIVVKGRFERNNQVAKLYLTVIDPEKNREIGWFEADSQTNDLVALQNQAVAGLARLMNVSNAEDKQQENERPIARAAYDDYLSGLGYFARTDRPGNIDLAIAALEKAVKTDPNFALAFARLAQVYTMKYRLTSTPEWLQKAETFGKQAMALDPRLPSAYVALGQVHEFTGKHDLAIQEFHEATKLDPRDPDAIAGIAYSYESSGRNPDAEAAYLKAAILRPDDWQGYNDLGNFYEDIGRPEDAIQQYHHALQLAPENSWIYENLGQAYTDFDDPEKLDEAENAFKKSIALDPSCTAFYNLGFLYAERHRFQDSVAASREAVRLDSKDYHAWYNLSVAYDWLKNDPEADLSRRNAIEIIEHRVSADSQDAEAQATLAVLYAELGERTGAREKIRISLALPLSSKYVHLQLANAYQLLGERREAVISLRRALTLGLNMGQVDGYPELQGILADIKRAKDKTQ